jgi:hypothetical protein
VARATFLSDMGLLVRTLLRRWNPAAAKTFIAAAARETVKPDAKPATTGAASTIALQPATAAAAFRVSN